MMSHIPNESLAYILLLFAAGILMIILALYAFRKSMQNGTHSFAWLCLSISVYALFYALELLGPSPERSILWNKLQYIGIVSIPPLALLFVIFFIGKGSWLRGGRVLIPFIIPAVILVLKFTDPLHGLIYRDYSIEQKMGMFIIDITPGFWYWVNVGYINLILLVSVILMVRFFLYSGSTFRYQGTLMLIGMAAPWIGHLSYLTGNSYLGLDASPIYFSVFGIFIALGIFRFGLFDLLPIARESIFENMRDGVLVVDTQNRVLDINPACRKIFPELSRQVTGKFIDKLFIDCPDVSEFIRSGSEVREIALTSGGNRMFFLATKTPVYNRSKKIAGTIIGFQDITQNKLSEAALKKEKQKAEEANLAKSEFLANMSHEIRTPMNAILGFTETLFHRLSDPALKKMVQSVASSGKILLSLLNDILDLSKIEAGRLSIDPQPANLPLLLSEIHMLFKEKIAQKGLRMHVEQQDDFPPSITVDEIRVRQVLFNLIGNAVKFTHKGNITIRLHFSPDMERSDPLPAGTGNLHIEVEDTGIGIQSDQLEAIFEPFYQQSGQSNREYGGTGLGLTISSRLVEKMNGSIQVRSIPGEGSLFQVDIPDVAYSDIAPDAIDPHFGINHQETQPAGVSLSESITEQQRRQLPALLQILKNVLLPEWTQIRDQLVIFKIEAFANKLKETGQTHGLVYLESYAAKLLYQADQLDLEGMKDSLSQFPSIIEELESLAN